MAARQVELLTEKGWWPKANTAANQLAVQFSESGQKTVVATCRGKALRNLAYLALQGKNAGLARE